MNTPVVFRKTLLALAVTGATMPVLAQTLGQDGLLLQDAIVPVEVTGSFNGAFAIDSDAARYAVIEGGGSSFGGHLTFKTDIDAQGDGIAAIELWDPKINGDVLLAGTTKVTGGDFTEFNDGELDTWGVHGVVITGELENNQFLGEIRGSLRHTGTLEVEGTGNAEAVGLYLSEVATESVTRDRSLRFPFESFGLLGIQRLQLYPPRPHQSGHHQGNWGRCRWHSPVGCPHGWGHQPG